jgi:PTS system N-acetylglucosamine-specific IIC component
MRSTLEFLQSLGRALMLPIAVLPIAGLLLRCGQADLLDMGFVAAAGDAIFSNLGLLFAIGVAVGLAKDGNGAAGLAGAVCFLIASRGAMALLTPPADMLANVPADYQAASLAAFKGQAIGKLNVPIGVLSGVIAGRLYNRFHALTLPDYLAFFAGRRFVPIVSGLAGLGLALLFGSAWHWLDHAIGEISRTVLGLGPLGLFLYGVLNRLLIIFGLHHILNNMAWFILGDFHGVTGDLNRFFAGDPSAGTFMAGFFPVMMFGLPAACLAMYHCARPANKAAVGGMLLSMALTALLTGVTEPIEFTFMFLAPLLYGLHAVLTGLAFVIMQQLGVHLGFSFSAGLFDFLINYKLASRPLLLLPVGAVYFLLYYGLFRLFIRLFDLATPGRAPGDGAVALPAGRRDAAFVAALGGRANLIAVDACTTRLRLIIADHGKIDAEALRALGAKGLVRPSDTALQVVLGPIADQIAGEIRSLLQTPPQNGEGSRLLDILGGRDNIVQLLAKGGRLLIEVKQQGGVSDAALQAFAPKGVVCTGPGRWQLLVGADAEALAIF